MKKTYDNSGTLGKNERREKETHPTHTGKCLIEGKEYYVNAWVKEGPTGKFFSLSFKAKEARGSTPLRREEVPGPRDDFDADTEIPF